MSFADMLDDLDATTKEISPDDSIIIGPDDYDIFLKESREDKFTYGDNLDFCESQLIKYNKKILILRTPFMSAQSCDFKKGTITVSSRKLYSILSIIPELWITDTHLQIFGLDETIIQGEKAYTYLQFDMCFQYDTCGSSMNPYITKIIGKK